MTIQLNTWFNQDTICTELTFADNQADAGQIEYCGQGFGSWRYVSPLRQFKAPWRACMKAAQYDALAWAEDQRAAAQQEELA